MFNNTRALLIVALTAAVVLLTGAASPLTTSAAGKTHTWVGADPTNNRNWGSPKNWSDQEKPQAGDFVVIEGFAVENVAAVEIFAGVTLKKGATLVSGGPLFTHVLDLQCSTLQISATVDVTATFVGGELRPTAPGETIEFVNLGTTVVRRPTLLSDGCPPDSIIDANVLKLFPRSSFSNRGFLVGDNGQIEGMACCRSPQVVDNAQTGTIDATDGLTLESLRLRHRGRIIRGTLTLDGGDHILMDSARFKQVTVLADGGIVRFADSSSTGRGTVTLGEASTFALTGGAEVVGFGTWSGVGTLALREGALHGRQTISPKVTLSVSGPLPKSIGPTRKSDPGEVIVEGEAILDTGPLTIGGKLINKGTITVAAGQRPRLIGSDCCVEPVPELLNDGTVRVARNAKLTLQSMRLENQALVSGEGELILDGGDHRLRGRSTIDLKTTATHSAQIQFFGAVTLDAELEQKDNAILIGGDSVSVGGRGSWSWQDGDVHEQLTFGGQIDVLVAGPSQKWIQTSTELTLLGPVKFDHNGALILRNGAKLSTFGTVTLAGGRIGGSNCCSDPALVVFGGPVTLERGSPVSTVNSADVTFLDTVDLQGGILEIPDLDPVFAADSGAKLLLGGGTFRAAGVVVFGSETELVGPGIVVASTVHMNGGARLAERGRLLIRGSYDQSATGVLKLTFNGANRDLLAVEGTADLAGSLQLSGVASVRAASWSIVTAGSVFGGFRGLSGLGARHELDYATTRVLVRRK